MSFSGNGNGHRGSNGHNGSNGHKPSDGRAASVNVIGGTLEACSFDPLTGFYRNGGCDTGEEDAGVHAVCAQMTAEFLVFSQEMGNDLSTPAPEYGFAGLKPGDRWCLCADRWQQALDAGVAPPVVLKATHRAALEFVELDELKKHAVDAESEK